jgi:CheY-like chemotaxis protein
MPVIRVLHLEADPGFSRLVASLFGSLGPESALTRVDTREGFFSALATGLFHIVLADHRLPAFDGLDALDHVRRHHPWLPFVFLTGEPGEELAVASLQGGASDYLLKTNLARVMPAVIRATEGAQDARRRDEAQERVRTDQANLRVLIESAADAIWSMDSDCRVVAFNSAASLLALKMGGEPLAPGSDMLGPLSEQGRAWWQDAVDKVRGGHRVVEEYIMTWKGNRYRLEVSLSPIVRDGHPKGIAVFCRDLAHR